MVTDKRPSRKPVPIVKLPSRPHGDARQPGTQVVQRVSLLLRLITANHRHGMRLVDLARESGLERPTAHRLLQALIAERLVLQQHQSKLYHLGPALYEMGLAAAPSMPLRDLCHPHLMSIAEATGDTVFLTARSGFDGVCVDRVEGAYPIKVFVLDVGRRRPLQVGGGGVAILSALTDDEIARIGAANAPALAEHYPGHSDADLRRRVLHARRHGYVVKDVLEMQGVRTVAVPLRDPRGQPVAAISVATLSTRLDTTRAAEVAQIIRRAVTRIEQQLREGA